MTRRIWTADTVLSRCTLEGECWIWQGALLTTGYPQACIHGRPQAVRTFVFYELMGRDRSSRHRVVSRCGNRLCCSPEHLMGRTVSAVIALQHKQGSRRNTIRTVGEAHPFAKLTREQVEALRALPQPIDTAAEAKRLGVQPDTIRKVLNGARWKRQPARSVFEYRP